MKQKEEDKDPKEEKRKRARVAERKEAPKPTKTTSSSCDVILNAPHPIHGMMAMEIQNVGSVDFVSKPFQNIFFTFLCQSTWTSQGSSPSTPLVAKAQKAHEVVLGGFFAKSYERGAEAAAGRQVGPAGRHAAERLNKGFPHFVIFRYCSTNKQHN
jgi:hypothetical protein